MSLDANNYVVESDSALATHKVDPADSTKMVIALAGEGTHKLKPTPAPAAALGGRRSSRSSKRGGKRSSRRGGSRASKRGGKREPKRGGKRSSRRGGSRASRR